MSEVRKIFFELLNKSIENEGYLLKKTKGVFEKKNNNLLYSILFSWDGRGGTSYLNAVNGIISVPQIATITQKLLAYKLDASVYQPPVVNRAKYKITQMYSPELIQLANNMNFKAMAAMPFEKKYPMENIQKTVNTTTKFIKEEIVNFHNSYQTEHDILNWYINNCKHRITQKEELLGLANATLITKILCKKLNVPEPDFIQNIKIFTNQSIDPLWNMQYHDFENMEKKFNEAKF